MKSKRLISLLCAAAMTTSAFAGLSVTASAAATPVWTFDGSSTDDWEGTVTPTVETDEGSTDEYLNFVAAVNKASNDTTFVLPTAAQLTDDYVLEYDTYIHGGNGMGRLNHYTQVAFAGESPVQDTQHYGSDYATAAEAINPDPDHHWSQEENAGNGYTTDIVSSLTSRIELSCQGKWVINQKNDTPNFATDGTTVGDDKWVRVRVEVKGGKAKTTIADSNQTYVDGVEFDTDATGLAQIKLTFGRADQVNFVPTTASTIKLDNIKVYDGIAGTPAFSTNGLRKTAVVATPVPRAENVAGPAPNLFAPEGAIAPYKATFDDAAAGTILSVDTAAQDPKPIVNGMTLNIGNRPDGADTMSYGAIVDVKDGSKALKLQANNYATNGRGPVASFDDDLSIDDLTGTTSVLGFAVYLSRTTVDGIERLFLIDNTTNVDGNNCARDVVAVLTTEDVSYEDEDGNTVYRYTAGESNIGVHLEPEQWNTVALAISETEYRIFVNGVYKTDGRLSHALKNDLVGTGEGNKNPVLHLPMFAIENTKASTTAEDGTVSGGTVFSSVLIDNVLTYQIQGEVDDKLLPTTDGTDPTKAPATPTPTPTPEPIAKVTMALNDAKTGVTMTSDIATDAVLIRASYTPNGTISAVKVMKKVSLAAGTAKEETLLAAGETELTKGDKIMLWDNTKRMAPLAAAIPVTEGAAQATDAPIKTQAPTTAPATGTPATGAPVTPPATGTPATQAPVVTQAPTAAPKFAVTVASDITNGTVTADKKTAAAGETVTLTVTPAMGYEGTVTVTADGEAVTVTDNKFTMPAKAVNVTATFTLDTTKQVIAAAHTAHAQWGSNTAEATMDNASEYFNMDSESGWTAAAFMEFDITNVDISTLDTATVTYTATSGKGYGSTMYYLTGDVDLSALAADATSRFTDAKVSVNAAVPSVQNGVTLTQDITEAVKARLAEGKTSVILQLTGNNGGANLSGKASDKAPVLLIQKGEAAGKEIAVTVKDNTNAPVEGAVVTAVKKAASQASLMALNPVYTTAAKTNAQGVATLRLADGDYTITASKDKKTIKSADMTVNAESAAALEIKETTYAVAINGGAETVVIPAGELYTAPAAFTAAVTADTAAVDGAAVAWSVKEADTKASISEAGVLTVDKAATAGNITLVATYTTPEGNKVTAEKTVALTAPVAATIEVSGDAEAAIPEAAEVAANYSAVAKDAHGNVLADQTFTWSVEGDNVSIANGALTVQPAATAGNVTVKAAVGSVEGTKTVALIAVPTYAITVTTPTEGGTLTASSAKAAADRTVTITAVPATGYKVADNGLTVSKAEGTVATTAGENNTYTFTMPAEAVTVAVTYEKIAYAITNATAADAGGTITVATTAQMGDTVTVTATPAEGKIFGGLTVVPTTEGSTTAVAVTGNTFVMPAEPVTVTAIFKSPIHFSDDFDSSTVAANTILMKNVMSGTPDTTNAKAISGLTMVGNTRNNGYAIHDIKLQAEETDKCIEVNVNNCTNANGGIEIDIDNAPAAKTLKHMVLEMDVKMTTAAAHVGFSFIRNTTDKIIGNEVTNGLVLGEKVNLKVVKDDNAAYAIVTAANGASYITDIDPTKLGNMGTLYFGVGSGTNNKWTNIRIYSMKLYETNDDFVYPATITVKDNAETPAVIADADVTIKSGETTVATGRTSAEGTFSANLPAGTYSVTAAKTGYDAPATAATLTITDAAASVEVTLNEQSDPEMDVTVNTVPFATVKLNAGTSTGGTAVAEQTVTANKDGVATLTAVRAGSYTADVTSANKYLQGKTGEAITIAANTPVNLALDYKAEYANMIFGEDFSKYANNSFISGGSSAGILLAPLGTKYDIWTFVSTTNNWDRLAIRSVGLSDPKGCKDPALLHDNLIDGQYAYFGAFNSDAVYTGEVSENIDKIVLDTNLDGFMGNATGKMGMTDMDFKFGEKVLFTLTAKPTDADASIDTIGIKSGEQVLSAKGAWVHVEITGLTTDTATVKVTKYNGTTLSEEAADIITNTVTGITAGKVFTISAPGTNTVNAGQAGGGMALDNVEIYKAAATQAE